MAIVQQKGFSITISSKPGLVGATECPPKTTGVFGTKSHSSYYEVTFSLHQTFDPSIVTKRHPSIVTKRHQEQPLQACLAAGAEYTDRLCCEAARDMNGGCQ